MSIPTGVIGRSVRYVGLAQDLRRARKSDDETVRSNARHHLSERMGKLKGLPQKIGQIMSMGGDDGDPLERLHDQAAPLPFDVIEPMLVEAWGAAIDTVVTAIDPVGRAASLGQVHLATLHDGSEVAVKVAYPGIREAVASDLKMLGWLSSPVGDLRRGFNLADYRAEIVRDIEEELDYRIERSHQQRYAALAPTVEGLVVPACHPALSTDRVLVSAWEDGETIDAVGAWPARAREELARRLLKQFLAAVFIRGSFHADPHPGNYRFRLDPNLGPAVVLYDYGSVAALTELDRAILLRLIGDTAARCGDPTGWLIELGFNPDLLGPIRAKLPAVCSVLFEPFMHDFKYDLANWRRTERIDDILGADRWNFRMAGPSKLLLLMRAFSGLVYYLERLTEPVSWGLAIKPVQAAYAATTARLTPPTTTGPEGRFESMARHLRIEVCRNGRQSASITMPAAAIDDLDDIIDKDVLRRIDERGIDLADIVREVRSNGYAPAEVFTLTDEATAHQVRVWIE